MRSARDGAVALATVLQQQNGTAAAVLRDEIAGGDELLRPGPAQIAAGGPRAAGLEAEYELLIEMIHEGSRLHYGGPRVIRDDDLDLALLLGDQLYAMGLSRLAEIGDLDGGRGARGPDLAARAGQAGPPTRSSWPRSGRRARSLSVWLGARV